MSYKIPFNKPFIVGQELYYIAQAVLNGRIAGDAVFTHRCQKLMEDTFGAKKILLTHSCTAALEMAAILSGVAEGDEVILPSFTFVSTANAFYLRGARLKFIDIRPDNLNLDETALADAVTPRTKVVVPVHYAGIGCEMDTILDLARKHGFLVIEDAAQGVNATYKGKYLGTLGDFGTYSFHETKNYICGEGGALIINNDEYVERAEIIREKGTNRSQFFRGEVDKYSWVDIGSSFLPSDMLAAFLYAQLENMDKINKRRADIYDFYLQALQPLADEGRMTLPSGHPDCVGNNHLFYIILEDERTRDALMGHLKSHDILAVFHYLPLHLSPVGRKMGGEPGSLPVTESIAGRLLRLPFYYALTREEQEEVVGRIGEFFAT
ncbi:dTDP-4-amino-4,6-dideoxygalactose transaminase [bacterium]|nr:dTDP-4-amino-4,6-dideoxygalactose transaminase [bacterium]MBU1074016.1 dTDP-4-amino-4,6-dideoxygalactose transaminase [bacterium]MBU1677223.1 dTDP-4-amino-4,6-dideoxygalactose transaminase [bacterium]